jgi:hypothetical protein
MIFLAILGIDFKDKKSVDPSNESTDLTVVLGVKFQALF